MNLLKTLDLRLSFVYNKKSGIFATIYFFVAHTHAKAGFYETDEREEKTNLYGNFCAFVSRGEQRAGFSSRKTGFLRENNKIKGGVQRKSRALHFDFKKAF